MEFISACTLDCPDGCSLLIKVDSDGGIHIGGNPDHPFTAGFTCAKVRGYPRRLRSPNRITEPLLKTRGEWRPISWDEALGLCAENIRGRRGRPASILHLYGGANKGDFFPPDCI